VSGKTDSSAHDPASADAARDPVCGMSVDRQKSLAGGYKETYQGETYVFCSDKCRKQFQQDPGKYLQDRLRSAADSRSGRRDD
jgi:Cu+-exporting ATPase